MPNVAFGKEKTSPHVDKADPEHVAAEPLPPQKVLKIFSLNIIAQEMRAVNHRVRSFTRRVFVPALLSPLTFNEPPLSLRRRPARFNLLISGGGP
ncbi:hypothetical protein EYF80_000208 [Liparis tanakae]|uniref:Uncharacterized protein n=1 Tax=Liparis tanakae TaxID=230148 RepID=A0A4Z2JH60_9TELE|nr:hypothetical protein EYF80_000208 [Liparis tanakae]